MSQILEWEATDHQERGPEEGEAGDPAGEVGLAAGEAAEGLACIPVHQHLTREGPGARRQNAALTRVLGLMAPRAKMVEV